MTRFLYSAAMSLDGFIAGPGGDMSWVVDYLGGKTVRLNQISVTHTQQVANLRYRVTPWPAPVPAHPRRSATR